MDRDEDFSDNKPLVNFLHLVKVFADSPGYGAFNGQNTVGYRSKLIEIQDILNRIPGNEFFSRSKERRGCFMGEGSAWT